MKRPASTEKEDKEFKKVKLELESKNTTKKEVKSDEDDGTTSEIKKHLKKLTREVSFRSFFLLFIFSLQLTSTSQVLQIQGVSTRSAPNKTLIRPSKMHF